MSRRPPGGASGADATAGRSSLTNAPKLRLPCALLEYAVGLPGDHVKLVLRLLQRTRWIETSTADGSPRELRFLLSVNDLWEAMLLDRDAVEDVAAFRHVLDRLERCNLVGDATGTPSTTPEDEVGE